MLKIDQDTNKPHRADAACRCLAWMIARRLQCIMQATANLM
jgi:hypothetical protein